MEATMESERTGEYLEAIYKREAEKSPVSTSALAEDLKVSQPAVTDMLRHLKSQGLIEYSPNKGAALTQSGREKAVRLIRRHRLWERFLTDVLGIKWDRVHDEACKLEHIESPDIEDRLSTMLANRDTCPHGHPIPDADGQVKQPSSVPLSTSQPGTRVQVVSINKEEPDLLRKVERMNLGPRAIATVKEKRDDGSMELESNGTNYVLDSETVAAVNVTPVCETAKAPEIEIPLSQLSSGDSAVIVTYSGRRGFLGRCLSLGLAPGSQITVTENYKRGPIVVRVHDTTVALGRGLADKIMVKPLGSICQQ